MRWLVVAMLALVSACTSAGPATTPATDRIGYDVSADTAVRGQYIVSGVYPADQGVNPDHVKWRTLLRGAEAIRKDGYDLIIWSGPQSATATQTMGYRSTTGSGQGFATKTPFLGVIYVVRGYNSSSDHPAGARSVSALMDRIALELAK